MVWYQTEILCFTDKTFSWLKYHASLPCSLCNIKPCQLVHLVVGFSPQHIVNSECKGSVEKQSGEIAELKIPTFVKFHHATSCNANIYNEMRKGNINNEKRKNCFDKQMYDGSVAKVSVHNKQACNIQMSLEWTHKKMKSAPVQMHAGCSFGNQAMAKSMCRDDVSTVGLDHHCPIMLLPLV